MTNIGKDRAVVPIQVLLKRVVPFGVLVAVVMTLFGSFAVAHAAGSATFQDNADLFTSAGRSRIAQAAQNANLRVKVLTTAQSFSSVNDWHSYVQQNAGGSGTVTIGLGLHVNGHKKIFVYPDPSTNISQSQADQAFANASSTFNSGTNSATSNGVIAIIQNLPGAATAPGGSGAPAAAPARGVGIGGILVPLIILGLLAFVLMRVLGRRRRNTVMPGYGPGYGQPPMGQGPYNQGQGGYPNQGFGNQGNQGGGFGRGILGGVAGGLAGSFIGNEIFGNRGGEGGNANAAGPDGGANAPGDTANAQDQQGGWGGDSGGGVSGADAGGWGGDSGGGGDFGGGGDSGGGWS